MLTCQFDLTCLVVKLCSDQHHGDQDEPNGNEEGKIIAGDKRTGLRVDPKPILAFPGWFVKENSVGSFRVANHKMVPSIVTQWRPQPLTVEQVDLISRQLDERCRDIED